MFLKIEEKLGESIKNKTYQIDNNLEVAINNRTSRINGYLSLQLKYLYNETMAYCETTRIEEFFQFSVLT